MSEVVRYRYCTREQLLRKLPERTLAQLTNDTAPASGPDWAIVAELAAEAEELIDSYLRQRNLLPFIGDPTLLAGIEVQLLRYACYERRPEGTNDLPPAVVRGWKFAMEQLEQIRDGKLGVGQQENPALAQPEVNPFQVRAAQAKFTDELLSQY